MSTDKTLADVQPGGRLRLATVLYDRAHDLLGDAYNAGTHGIGYSQQAMELHDAIIPVQPSPGGQGDAPLRVFSAGRWTYDGTGQSFSHEDMDAAAFVVYRDAALAARQPVGIGADWVLGYLTTDAPEESREAIRSAFAEYAALSGARQPVGATEQQYNSGGIELTACQLCEALLMAGDPELDVPFEDRSLVRIFWTETGHSGRGLYCECVGAEEEGCILLDGTAPAIGQPAQAVDLDLGQFRRPIEEWRSDMEKWVKEHGDYDGVFAKDIAEANRLLALIDSKAAGK